MKSQSDLLLATSKDILIYRNGGFQSFLRTNFTHINYWSNLLCVDGYVETRFYGIASCQGFYYATHMEYPAHILKLDKNGHLLDAIMPCPKSSPIIRPHSMCSFDDCLFVTSTSTDSIVRYNVATNQWDQFRLNRSHGFVPVSKKELYHVNGVFFHDGLMHCLVCSQPGQSGSSVLVYDYPLMKLVGQIPVQPYSHGLLWWNDDCWYCSSTESALVSLQGRRVQLSGFLKTVISTPDGLVVGSVDFADRGNRNSGSTIYFLDDELSIIESYRIDGNVGDIIVYENS